MKYLFIFFLISFALNASDLDSTFKNETLKKDSLKFKFNFKVGDKLTYKMIAHDSILVDSDYPLIKQRFQEIEINIDSINKKGNFLLTYKLTKAKSLESCDTVADVVNESHPMVNKIIKMEIDSVGKRIKTELIDKSEFMVGPGGAFEPYLFFNFEETNKAINESWIVESMDTLSENSNPASTVNQMSLFRLKGVIDTLDDKAIRIDVMKSSKGRFIFQTEKDFYSISNAINQWGLFDISMTKMVPLHYYTTCEQKLKINVGGAKGYKEGKHYISVYYTLIDYQNISKEKTKPKKSILPKKKIKK